MGQHPSVVSVIQNSTLDPHPAPTLAPTAVANDWIRARSFVKVPALHLGDFNHFRLSFFAASGHTAVYGGNRNPFMEDAAPLLAECAYPPPVQIGYVPRRFSCCGADELRNGRISEAHLRLATNAGGSVRRVLVVELGGAAGFLTYLRFWRRPGFIQLATRKYEDPKVFQDFVRLRKALANTSQYGGPVFVYPQGHAFLQRLGLPHLP